MPRRPQTSGYARIAQAEEEEEEDENAYSDDPEHDDYLKLSSQGPEYAPIQPPRRERMQLPPDGVPGSSSPHRIPRRRRTNSGVDIKAINARLERWAEEIKERFKIKRVKGKSSEDEHLEIYSSVFQAPEGIRPATKAMLENDSNDEYMQGRLSKLEFDDMVESVRTAIELNVHPLLISQGSSGSYFARNSGGKVLGVFKPKDEEPYANKNPKWTKWIHRNLFPFAFGRAMLIPNLSYVSEAAAYVLDCQLRTGLVPYTDVVGLSSKSFHYDYFERRGYYRKGKALPEKLGSFQVFLKGYKGATEFLREHPWPDQSVDAAVEARRRRRRKKRKTWAESCRPGSAEAIDVESEDEVSGLAGREQNNTRRGEFWSEELQQSFREELEKLVILDYIMRNTDRGTDNWMIKIDRETQQAQLVVEPPTEDADKDSGYKRRTENMTTSSTKSSANAAVPHIGAIDNSLSWPWKHPDAWRSYPFGWLFLPVSLIGRPFSAKTRSHFLPLLCSKDWWTSTVVQLRRCFEKDADFQEKMFARQIAVMKGQAWNVVECLKEEGLAGPLELCRRGRVMVWDDVVEVPVERPLVRASEEMRRRNGATVDARRTVAAENTTSIREEMDEEMDISAARDEETGTGDLLNLSPPKQADGKPNRFNLSRENSSPDIRPPDALSSPQKELFPAPRTSTPISRPAHLRSVTHQPPSSPHRSRMSHDIPRLAWQSPQDSRKSGEQRRRRFSFATRRGTNYGGEYDEDEEDDEGNGDLGFAAVGGREGVRRRVIVERLEVVKSKAPFFSWC
ncbi:Phosphatidylinositol 4-kinase LSB6 [Recurvomyces mirabilis]|uniref:Phosphatidylinositol 4-kinase n=1 Tax=Recurvomyces mirabilis TaxID=574656 RepID=A0AAE0WHN5_9PEZI|nr:Phosphatidylinositol 4-kinase LSB6 [Recurvomyces mirabilis]KAK5156238.1 Phosphatidylinositol 4-kinase LSB6 [Recurvomyces mirabilis]